MTPSGRRPGSVSSSSGWPGSPTPACWCCARPSTWRTCLRAATRVLGARLGRPDLPYVQVPPDGLRAALLGAGMSESGASAMVELQLDLNRQRSFAAVRAAADATTPTRLEAFLSEVLR